MNKNMLALLACGFALTGVAHADELDPVLAASPESVIVRADSNGNGVAFKSDAAIRVTDDASAALAVKAAVKIENQLQNIAKGELDQVSSDDSWHYYYDYRYSYGGYSRPYYSSYYGYNYPSYYSYSYRYNYSSYVSVYRPTYTYYYGGYSYVNYSRSGCYPSSYSRYRW